MASFVFFSLQSIETHTCSGIYASLVPVSMHIMMKKGFHTPSQKIMFGVIVFMFSLSTASLAVSIADLVILIKAWYLVTDLSESSGTRSPTEALLVLFNSLTAISYALTDGVVVWRAWIICRDECRKLLRAPIVMLILTMRTSSSFSPSESYERALFPVGVAATIGVRVFINIDPANREDRLADTIDVFQEITFISSLITNILGTGIISLKAWRYRRWIVTDLQRVVNKRTKAERVLALLVESGVLYVFSGALLVASSLVRLPGSQFVLGSFFLQAAVHLAGMYPVIVVILVSREASMDKTLFNSTLPIIITDLQQASSQFRANQIVAHPTKSTPVASFQSVAVQGPRPTQGSPDSSLSQNSLLSSSGLGPEVDMETQSDDGGSVK
ncbi:hypothetical protein EDB89DRAFT_2202879 [Lactarius sanguifluus]|nr:hypothetical protein EDB89DRAFT_2202879 [Lactarius sanguifluus]